MKAKKTKKEAKRKNIKYYIFLYQRDDSDDYTLLEDYSDHYTPEELEAAIESLVSDGNAYDNITIFECVSKKTCKFVQKYEFTDVELKSNIRSK